MSVIIRGVQMPKDCFDCPCFNSDQTACNVTDEIVSITQIGRLEDCPFVEKSAGKEKK